MTNEETHLFARALALILYRLDRLDKESHSSKFPLSKVTEDGTRELQQKLQDLAETKKRWEE